MDDPLRVAVHPFHGPGLREALDGHDGLCIVTPEDGDGVVEELASGTRGLITYQWEDRFASGGVEWIQALSAGVDQFPEDLLRDGGIMLTSARGAHSPAVAEHAIALMMSVVRAIGPSVRGAAARDWQPIPAYEVAGRTMGILGLGSIGESIAVKAKALGMQVIGTKQSISGYQGAADEVFGPDDTLEVCRHAEVLVISLPQDPSTAGLIGVEELSALDAGWLVNVGRGSVVNEAALVAALTDGQLRGAGLDVTVTEPLPDDSPLWDHPGVVITPHMGWSSDRLSARLAEIIVANALALQGQGDWVNRVI
jgi:phosphoglycerate dehydrogenase-like enzyme